MRKSNFAACWAVAGLFCLMSPTAGATQDLAKDNPAPAEAAAAAAPAAASEMPAVSQAKQAYVKSREARKRERSTRNRADRPHDSVAFYVNKRTGPILTRGPNKTVGMRGLDPGKYLTALAKARKADAQAKAIRAGQVGRLGAAPGATLGTWEALGPNNQGGRTRQLLIDPRNPDTMYAAAVGGGVWKSVDGGLDWTQLTDLLLPNIAVASLAMDPSNSQVLYAGTGEGFFNGDAIRGAGIFKTTDGGATWAPLASTTPPEGTLGNFSYVTQIVVSPRAPQRVYATTRNGLYRSNDGGATWARLIDASSVNGCQDVTLQLKRAVGYVFAACGTFAQASVYRAVDGPSSTFAAVFSVPNMGRTSLAIAPSNESVVYAMSASNEGTAYGDGLLGVFRSTANGNSGSWTTQVSNTNPGKINTLLLSNPVYGLGQCFGLNSLYNQGWYDNVIAVDPLDANRVWAGGIDLFRSDDGGQTWGVASYWWFDKGVDPWYAHADQHVIRFHPGYNGTTNKKMFVASDGGIFRTDDARANVGKTDAAVCGTPVAGAVTWTELNNNYNTTQFYHGAVYPDGSRYFGGLQDNGTKRGGIGSLAWQTLQGGDGGYNAVDTRGDADPNNDVLFAEYTGLSIQKSTDGGANFFDAVNGISDPGFDFIAPFHMNAGNRQQLWTGGWYLWRTTDQAAVWSQASAVTPGNGSVSAVAVSPQNPNRAVAAMSDGYLLFNTSALTASGSTAWGFTRPRAAFATSVTFDPSDANVAYATYATFSGVSLYKSVDAGATWSPLVGTGATALPKVPALTVVVDPSSSQRIYVGTDIGVYTTLDGGLTWYREVAGFGNVSVEHLEINSEGTRRLYAFTHGRGAWRVNINP